MARVLVTGANGFLGSHLCNALEDEHEVIGLVRSDKPKKHDPLKLLKEYHPLKLLGARHGITIVMGDVRYYDLIIDVIKRFDVEAIVHLAAQAYVKRALKDPRTTVETNIMGTFNILEAARECDADYVIIQSTDKVYGDGLYKFEEDHLRPKEIYSVSKACADLLAQTYAKVYGLRLCVVRPSNIYGPCDMTDRIIPNMIRDCLRGGRPKVFEGVIIRHEFTYVSDYTSAIKLLLRGRYEGVYNIGSGDIKDQEEVAKEIAKHFNVEPEYMPPPEHVKAEINEQSVDSSRIRSLGWVPRVSFEEGIRKTVDWWKWYWANYAR